MSRSSAASVPPGHAGRYLQQLRKHWTHTLELNFTPVLGGVAFPKDARVAQNPGGVLVIFEARARTLEVRIDATSSEQLESVKDAVARHPDRFAFREARSPFAWISAQ